MVAIFAQWSKSVNCSLVSPASRIKARKVPLASSQWLGTVKRRWEGRRKRVAAGLMIHFVSEFTERLDCVRAGTDRQTAHAGTSTTSSLKGSGTASPAFPD